MRTKAFIVSASSPSAATPTGIGVVQQTGRYDAARPFGTLRDQAAIQQAWTKERLEVNLPKIMRQQGVDMWVGYGIDWENIASRGSHSSGVIARLRPDISKEQA